MMLVIILKPLWPLVQDHSGVRPIIDVEVIPLERLHESLGHAIALWAIGRCTLREQVDGLCKTYCIMGKVILAVIRPPLSFVS